MTSYFRFAFLTLAILAGATSTGQAGSSSSAIDISLSGLQSEHNRYRLAHQALPLRWSSQLAAGAQNWANSCTRGKNGNFIHSDGAFKKYGENWAAGYRTPQMVVASWYDERPVYERFSRSYTVNYPMTYYQFNADNSKTETSYGHFTQVVWKATQEIGCGYAKCGTTDYWVCRYSSRGNVVDQFQKNVAADPDCNGSCWCSCTFLAGCRNTCTCQPCSPTGGSRGCVNSAHCAFR